jgi:beta-galactosidase
VQDAQGRPAPTADNQVSFRVAGPGAVIGVGNGDPTNHEPDRASSRKAFNGLCMALVQSSKAEGSITVEASSPGLTPASVTISSRAVKLRPQAPVWEREVPAGSGITGLWRTAPAEGGRGFGAGQVFTLRQNGSALTGTVEGSGGIRGAGDTPVEISEGKVDGANVSFKAGNVTYTGKVAGDRIELERTGGFAGRGRPAPAEPTGPRPAIGPPPDGSDPSSGFFINGGRGRAMPTPAPVAIIRAKR